MDTVVLKFGGSSVSNNENLKIVANKIIKLRFSSSDKKVKYQIFVKKKGKYTKVKTTSKKKYNIKHKKQCYIKVRTYKKCGKNKAYNSKRTIRLMEL